MRRGWVLGAASAVLFGAATPASKVILDHVGPVTLAGLLYLGAACISALVVLRQGIATPTRRDLTRLAGAVVVGGAVSPVLLLVGLRHTPAGTASLLLNLELVATTLIAWLVYSEHIGRRAGIGLAVVAVSGLLLAGSGDGVSWGALLIAGACLGWGVDNNLTANATSIGPAQVTLAKGAVAGSVNLLLGLAFEQSSVRASTVGWALLVGAFGYGLSITLWVASARLLGTARSQGVFATAPFVGVAIGWVVLREPVLAPQLIALAAMVIGVWLAMTSDHAHPHRHPPLVHSHAHRHDDDHHHHHPEPIAGAHVHEHEHHELVHAHRHLPDELHRHRHDGDVPEPG